MILCNLVINISIFTTANNKNKFLRTSAIDDIAHMKLLLNIRLILDFNYNKKHTAENLQVTEQVLCRLQACVTWKNRWHGCVLKSVFTILCFLNCTRYNENIRLLINIIILLISNNKNNNNNNNDI